MYDDEGIGVISFIIALILTIIIFVPVVKEAHKCENEGGIYLYREFACFNPKNFVKGK